MVGRRTILPAFALALALAAGWYWHWTRDDAVIRRRFARLLETIAKTGPEGPIQIAGRAQSAGRYFASQLNARVGEWFFQGSRAEAVSLLGRTRASFQAVSAHALDIDMTVDADRQTALMQVAIQWSVDGSGSLDEFEVTWRKENGDWRIESVLPAAVIRAPTG